jgi:murein DD-endopeptidase MepM/ murein hydrolase activator NlpD
VAELTRILKLTVPVVHGLDVEGWARGAHRYLKDGQLGEFEKQRDIVKQTFGTGKQALAKKCQKKAGLPQSGWVGTLLMERMTEADAFDSLAEFQIATYAKVNAPPTIVYPHPAGANSSICQGLHPTAGIAGNWAYDFCSRGGTPVLAVQNAVITRLSGRDPALPPDDLIGIWGWSIWYQAHDGYEYFSTHYGKRVAREGQKVKAGTIIGLVGSWPLNPGRSHTHLGCSSVYGERAARKRITQVSNAPRVQVPEGV